MMSVVRGGGGEPEIVGELGDSREVGQGETREGGIHKVGEPEPEGDTFEGTGNIGSCEYAVQSCPCLFMSYLSATTGHCARVAIQGGGVKE